MKIRLSRLSLMGLLFSGLMLPGTAAAGVSVEQDAVAHPDYAGFELSSVVVRIDADDPDEKIVLEHFLAKEFAKAGITVHRYDDVFPATQAWTGESIRERHETLSIDAVMHVHHVGDEATYGPTARSQRVRYSETSMPTTSDLPSARYGGGPGYSEAVTSYGIPAPARTVRYQVELVDSTEGREVWRSTIETRVTGNHSKHQKMAKGTARAIVRGLAEGEFLQQE